MVSDFVEDKSRNGRNQQSLHIHVDLIVASLFLSLSLRTIIHSTDLPNMDHNNRSPSFRCLSFADDLRAESAGRCTSWHERNDRLSHGGLSTGDELLVPRRGDDTVQREVHDEHHGEQLQGVHEADHKELAGW